MPTPILYHYHPFTKEYVGSSAARENPLEKGKFLYPKNSTLVDIVDIPKGSVAVFDGTSWDIVKDNRGVIYYDIDGNKFIHNDLSEIPVWSIPIYPQETDENHNLFSIYNPASGKIKKIHFLPAKMWMDDNGWYELDETEPDKTIIQYAEKIGYKKIGGKYKIKWSIKDKTSQELADDIAAAKATANLKANELAETERLKYITPGYGQSNSYQEKYSQAVAFKADGNPDAQTYPYIYLEATETGSTPSDIADLIIATRNQFVALDAVIESKRRGYLVSIAAATTIAQVNTIKQAISYAQ